MPRFFLFSQFWLSQDVEVAYQRNTSLAVLWEILKIKIQIIQRITNLIQGNQDWIWFLHSLRQVYNLPLPICDTDYTVHTVVLSFIFFGAVRWFPERPMNYVSNWTNSNFIIQNCVDCKCKLMLNSRYITKYVLVSQIALEHGHKCRIALIV